MLPLSAHVADLVCQIILTLLVATAMPSLARDNQAPDTDAAITDAIKAKFLPAISEKWSIYAANYNIANLQTNGVADNISHLIYAFGNVRPPPARPMHNANLPIPEQLSDSLSSVGRWPARAARVMGTSPQLQLKQLHPNLKIMISLGGSSSTNAAGLRLCCQQPRCAGDWPLRASMAIHRSGADVLLVTVRIAHRMRSRRERFCGMPVENQEPQSRQSASAIEARATSPCMPKRITNLAQDMQGPIYRQQVHPARR